MRKDIDWEEFLYGESLSGFELFGLIMGFVFILFFLWGIFMLTVFCIGTVIVKIWNWKDGLNG